MGCTADIRYRHMRMRIAFRGSLEINHCSTDWKILRSRCSPKELGEGSSERFPRLAAFGSEDWTLRQTHLRYQRPRSTVPEAGPRHYWPSIEVGFCRQKHDTSSALDPSVPWHLPGVDPDCWILTRSAAALPSFQSFACKTGQVVSTVRGCVGIALPLQQA